MKTRLFVAATITVAMTSILCIVSAEKTKDETTKHRDAETETTEEEDKKPSVWMRAKVKGSEGVLRGLAEADFDSIYASAKMMSRFATVERWIRNKDPDYQLQFKVFRRANNKLMQAASREDLDGATLAYVQLTVSCVDCHQALRDKKAPVLPMEPE